MINEKNRLAWRVVETDNFCRDGCKESWVTPAVRQEAAQKIADILNSELSGVKSPHYYTVRHKSYKLQEGFEP